MKVLLLILLSVAAGGGLCGGNLRLASGGHSDYKIVMPPEDAVLDRIAARDLRHYLETATGAEFATVAAGEAAAEDKLIRVGAAVAGLAPQESVIAVDGDDLLLYGEGTHGAGYAVYRFLRDHLGCRWFTPYGEELVPEQPELTVALEGEERFVPSFALRDLMLSYYYKHPDSGMFFFRNGINEAEIGLFSATYPELNAASDMFHLRPPQCHTLFYYIPPTPEEDKMKWPWRETKYYFASHPEYFSMNAAGERVPNMQLCFANPELRRELTDRFLERIERENGRGYFNLSAMDWGGAFCLCDGCKALTAKYRANGGPLFDFLIELANVVKERFPAAGVSTLAYRKTQSEAPPAIAEKLPENLMVIFAPIDDNFGHDWQAEDNAETARHLRDWCRLGKVTLWYYPLPYNWGTPFASLQRLAADVRYMRDVGVFGGFFEHDVGTFYGFNFSDLYMYVIVSLYFDADADVEALVTEFTDFYYGAAAPGVRDYLRELEQQREKLTHFIPWDAGEGAISYLTPEWLMRWQQRFDAMAAQAAGDAAALARLNELRLALDLALLGSKYHAVKATFPELEPAAAIGERVLANLREAMLRRYPDEAQRKHWEGRGRELVLERLALAEAEPGRLPEPLQALDPNTVKQVFASRGGSTPDSAAGAGWAQSWDGTEVPFPLGVFDGDAQTGMAGLRLSSGDFHPDRYYAYRLEGAVKPNTNFYMYAGMKPRHYYQYCTEAFDPARPELEYDVYLSLKFEGPGYGSSAREKADRIWFDRVIFVPRNP